METSANEKNTDMESLTTGGGGCEAIVQVKIEPLDEDPSSYVNEIDSMKLFYPEDSVEAPVIKQEVNVNKDNFSFEQKNIKSPGIEGAEDKLHENETNSVSVVESSEPHGAASEDNYSDIEMKNLPVENVHVKVEPTWYSDDGDDDSDEEDNMPIMMLKNSLQSQKEKKRQKRTKYTRLVPINLDDTLPFKLQTKPLKLPPKPSASRKNCENAKLMFTAEVVERIEIVTISEEQRAAEVAAQWASRRHMRYTCRSCAMGFVTQLAYHQHLKVHDPQESGEHQCSACGQCVRTASALYKHRLRHYRRYRCTECGATHRDKEAAAAHVNTHVGRTFPCNICNINFKRPLYLRRHWLQQHSGDEVPTIPCPSPGCPRVFRERSQYRTHVRQHNEEVRSAPLPPAQYACPVCSRRFAVRSYMRKHLLTHDKSANFQCPYCPHTTNTKNALATHHHKHHSNSSQVLSGDPENSTCGECGAVCATLPLLRIHKRQMHNIRRPHNRFECDACGEWFQRKSGLRKHIVSEHADMGLTDKPVKVRTHPCKCSRLFRDEESLESHIEKCHGENPARLQCRHCGKAYETGHQLRRHESIHSGEKQYACDQCGERFRSKDYVKIHHQLRHLNMTRQQLRELKLQRMNERREAEANPDRKRRRRNRQRNKPSAKPPAAARPERVKIKVERESVEELHVPTFGMFDDILQHTD